MQIEQQKTINHGGKQTGKILGGMYFIDNAQFTDLDGGTDFVGIGNGNELHTPFVLTLPNEYFELTTIIPTVQAIRYTKGRESTRLTLKWSLTVKGVSGQAPSPVIPLELRIQKQDVLLVETSVFQTNILAQDSILGTRISGSTIVDVDPEDAFWIQVKNLGTGGDEDENVIFVSAEILLIE